MTSWKTIPADRYDVAVVGGGAAGMTAAIAAARAGAVALLERGERPGRKLLMTGNGKCNLGNRDLKPSHYYSDNMAMAASVLERFGTEETIAFFRLWDLWCGRSGDTSIRSASRRLWCWTCCAMDWSGRELRF